MRLHAIGVSVCLGAQPHGGVRLLCILRKEECRFSMCYLGHVLALYEKSVLTQLGNLPY